MTTGGISLYAGVGGTGQSIRSAAEAKMCGAASALKEAAKNSGQSGTEGEKDSGKCTVVKGSSQLSSASKDPGMDWCDVTWHCLDFERRF